MTKHNDLPAIRNAFHKIKVGDKVTWREWNRIGSGTVTAKEHGQLVVDGSIRILGCDITSVERDGQDIR